MANRDLVSIIMPAYNATAHMAEAIRSVIAQTYPCWELLVVDDASSDGSAELARRFQADDDRITVIHHRENQGVSAARNTALRQAVGKYVAFLDSDDLWDDEKLQAQLNLLQANNLLIAYSSYRRIDESGKVIGEVNPPEQIGYSELLKSNFIGNLTGIYNAEALGKQYFSDYRHEDYVAWLGLLKKAGRAESTGTVLASYRVYAGSTSANKLRVIAWQWRIYRGAMSLGLLRSCLLMCHYTYHALSKRLG